MKETKRESTKIFHFGESSYESKGLVEIPAMLKGEKFYLRTEVLQGDIPWLIGKSTMSKMGMMLNLGENVVEIETLGE